jgi:hypothetical protein
MSSFAKPLQQRQHPRGGFHPGLIRHRVGGLDDLDPFAGARIAVARDHQPLAGAIGGLDCFGHAGAGLARADHHQSPLGSWRQMRGERLHRVGDLDRAVEKAPQEGEGVLHGIEGLTRRSPAV